jgi:sugar lactone lactonase YvrE
MRPRRLFWILPLAFAVLLAAAAAGGLLEPWRPLVSYWLKHKPLCMAENAGLLAPRRAHYSAALGYTVDMLYCTPAEPPRPIGGPLRRDLVVVSDMGGVVQRIDAAGRLVWQRRLSGPRGLDIHGDRLLVGEGRTVRVLSTSNGADLQRFEFDQPILMVRQGGSSLFTLMDMEGTGAVRRYELSQNGARLVRSTPVVTRYPRGIDLDASGLYVADTFGNRVIRLDPDSLELRAQAASYFPNSVQVAGDRLLVVEEHLNVVSEFRMQPLERLGSRVGCSAHPPGVNLPDDTPARACDRGALATALYSPNDAVAADGRVYIADTDNHRIVEFFEGHVVAQLTGFNNPVNVRVAQP